MDKSKKLVFFGSEDFSAPSLLGLIESGWQIPLVVTKPDSPAGRGLKLHSPEVKLIARTHSIGLVQTQDINEIARHIKAAEADIGVLVAYGKILPNSIIDLFPRGIVNVHPSLLPKYRGPSPIEAAILSGDKTTGVSLMQLTQKMDAGPVYIQQELALNGSETRLSLQSTLAKLGARLLADKLHLIISGQIQPSEQDDTKATYTKLLKKPDGWIDWNSPAASIERLVRAYLGYPKARTKLLDRYEVVITKSQLVEASKPGRLTVKCEPGWLEITELIAPSGRTMSGADFLRGYKA